MLKKILRLVQNDMRQFPHGHRLKNRFLVAIGVTLYVHGHRDARNMRGIDLNVNIQGRDTPPEPLGTDAQLIDLHQEILFQLGHIRSLMPPTDGAEQ